MSIRALLALVLGACSSSTLPSPTDSAVPEDAAIPIDAALPKPLHVLFLGNSYTYVNDLPGQVRALVVSTTTPPEITVDSVTVGGATLWQLYKESDAVTRIRLGGWTHVVIQGQSTEAVWPISNPSGFYEYAKRLGDEANKVGAMPVYYETWARREDDWIYQSSELTPKTMQAELRSAYQKAAQSAVGVVAPVGDAWELALAEPKPPNLFASDGSHPSSRGTYLAGCVFFRVLMHRSVAGVGGYPPDISAADAAQLQGIADRLPMPEFPAR